MSIKHLAHIAAAAFSLAAGAASAATITFQFSGTVTYGAPMAVLPGTPIVGTYTYDTKTQPEISYKGFADYQIPAPHTMSATVGGHTITTGTFGVSVWNNYKGNVEDMLDVTGNTVVLDGTTFASGILGFRLASAPRHRKALRGIKLPHALDVADFDAGPDQNYGILQIDGGPTGQLLQFTIDSIVVLQTAP